MLQSIEQSGIEVGLNGIAVPSSPNQVALECEMAERLIRTYRFKLKPTRAQHDTLRTALEYTRQLYNAALEERIDCYRKTGKGRSYIDQCMGLSELRANGSIYCAVMERGPLYTLDRAYKAFFKRGGFPRFKGREWFKSISWPERGGWHIKNNRFAAKGIGAIRIQMHRQIDGVMKSCRIKRDGRHWYLNIACEVEARPLAGNDNAVGIDLGISSFAALSDGTMIPAPRYARAGHKELRRRARALARCERGSKRRAKVKARLAGHHDYMRRSRRTHHFQTASALVKNYGLIAVENLNVRGLAKGRIARDVNDAGWSAFLNILSDTAERACRTVVKVDARHTSQTCPDCGQVKPKLLSERVHACDCGFTADRDVAAAMVIKQRAVQGSWGRNVGDCAVRGTRKAAA